MLHSAGSSQISSNLDGKHAKYVRIVSVRLSIVLCAENCCVTESENCVTCSCLLFHYQHRRDPEAAGKEGEENDKRCCLARLASEGDVRKFIEKYNGLRWIQLSHTGEDVELPDKCAVRAARDGDFGNHSFKTKAVEGGEVDTIYMTKSQRRAKARQNSNKILGFLAELCPPQGLPQGNVGTPTKT